LPQATFHSRAVPMTRLFSDAMNDRPSAGRQAGFAQPFRALAIAGFAESVVEQRFARVDVG
jgi:hypothetical protein